jgi:hypothetical protein
LTCGELAGVTGRERPFAGSDGSTVAMMRPISSLDDEFDGRADRYSVAGVHIAYSSPSWGELTIATANGQMVGNATRRP